MSAQRSSLPHLPALDGLRGLAVAGVVWFHLGGFAGKLLRGGYLGVDLFFVLSGYLITSVLLHEHSQTGAINLKQFWIRRFRRLMPAVLTLMPAIALYGYRFARPEELSGLRRDALATLGYVANWRAVWSAKSYWEMFAAPSPLEHTWSLSIEEQFYVFWPLLIAFLLVGRKWPAARLMWASLVAGIASLALMALLYRSNNTTRVYFGTDTRIGAILGGAALAFYLQRKQARGSRLGWNLGGLLAALLLISAWSRLNGENPWLYRGGFLATELACLIVIAACTRQDTWVAKVLVAAPLRYLGKVSYGVYLWHWPIFCVFTPERTGLPTAALIVLRLATTLLVAELSHRFLEDPIRRNGIPWGRGALTTAAALAAAVGIVMLGTRARATKPNPLNDLGFAALLGPDGKAWPDRFKLGLEELPTAKQLPAGTLRILTLGDSVSQKLGNAMRIHAPHIQSWVADRGVGDCSIMENREFKIAEELGHPNPTSGCAANWIKDVNEVRPDVTFIIFGGAYLHDMTIDGIHENACGKGYQAGYQRRMDQLLAEMRANAGQIVLFLAPYPGDRWRADGMLEDVDCYNAFTRKFAEERGLPVIDVASYLCPQRECALLSEGEPIRPDGLHPECPGAKQLAQWTLREVQRIYASTAAARARDAGARDE